MPNFIHSWLSKWWARKAIKSMHLLQESYLSYITALPDQAISTKLSPSELDHRRQVVEKVFKALLEQSSRIETSQAVTAFNRKCKAFAKDPWAYALQMNALENN